MRAGPIGRARDCLRTDKRIAFCIMSGKRIGLWIWLLLACACVQAGGAIYRSTDADGVIEFSDQRTPGAEVVREPSINTVEPPPTAPSQASRRSQDADEKASEMPRYTRVAIVKPEADEAFWNADGEVSVEVALEPPLADGNRVALLLDGTAIGRPAPTTRFALQNVDRGTHTLVAQVVDADGKVIVSSPASQFTRHQPSQLRPNPVGN